VRQNISEKSAFGLGADSREHLISVTHFDQIKAIGIVVCSSFSLVVKQGR
jgi:hypothetical protein